jgi:hypothetical protein
MRLRAFLGTKDDSQMINGAGKQAINRTTRQVTIYARRRSQDRTATIAAEDAA